MSDLAIPPWTERRRRRRHHVVCPRCGASHRPRPRVTRPAGRTEFRCYECGLRWAAREDGRS
jgi:transposase-like protein